MPAVNQEAERIIKGMKRRSASRFRRLYGKRAKEVMYATANKLAQKEQVKMPITYLQFKSLQERADTWHPDPDEDRKLGGPGANQRAREDRAAASKPAAKKADPKKLRKGESYMDYAKRQKGYTPTKKKEGLRDKIKRKLGLKKEEVEVQEGMGDVAIKAIQKTKPPYLSKRSSIIRKIKQKQLDSYLKKVDAKKAAQAEKKTKNEEVTNEGAAWTKKSGKNSEGGLNEKGRKSYERENPGSDLKAPSKKVGNPRRASFCARMKGMKKKLTSKKTASDPDSRINKSLRAWNC